MNIERSDYVCAGFESFSKMMNNYCLNKRGFFENNFTRADIAEFFNNTCNKFLHSYGQNFYACRNMSKYSDVEERRLTRCRAMEFYEKSEFILDSGGFQISINRIPKEHTHAFIDLYHNFLVERSHLYDKAFVLDIPPGPGCKMFDSFDDVYDLNLNTYKRAANMPQHVKEKLIYIHHFRTPKLWEIYSKIMKEEELFNQFNYHGTGGIVANSASDVVIPCIIYVLPLIPLLNQCKKYGRTKLNFHILGGANYRDIFFYELFKLHIMKEHQIEVTITYDSSGMFKALLVARHFLFLDEELGCVNTIDVRSANINKRFKGNRKVHDVIREEIDSLTARHGFKKIPEYRLKDIYNTDIDSIHDDVKHYMMLHLFETYARVQAFCKERAAQIYPTYVAGDFQKFSKQVFDTTKNLNNEKITKKQKIKSQSMVKSLDMLTELDEDNCKYIVDKVLVNDEFTELFHDTSLKF